MSERRQKQIFGGGHIKDVYFLAVEEYHQVKRALQGQRKDKYLPRLIATNSTNQLYGLFPNA